MPNTTSAEKALRQNIRRRKRNIKRKNTLRETLKNYKKLIETGTTEEAQKKLPTVYKTLDKLAKVNLIKKSKASRLKSRLTKRLAKKAQ